MSFSRYARILCLMLLFPVFSLAQWVGFPLSEQEEDWETLRRDYNPIGQLYSGIVERAELIGVEHAIGLPSIVETWSWYAGTNLTTTVETNVVGAVTNIYTYTNIIVLSTNVVTTNAISPIAYSFSDISGAHTATGFPVVTQYFMRQLDIWIETLIPYYLNTNQSVNGSFDNWFATKIWVAGSTTNYWANFPTNVKAELFQDLGVGFSTNLSTNVYGVVERGDSYWTKQAATTGGWLLAESHYSTNDSAWHFVDASPFDTNYYIPYGVYPVVQYTSSSTNYDNLPISLVITGTVLNISNQTIAAATESISVTSSNTPLTNYWYDITGISSATSVSNSDVVAIAWTNELVMFGAWAWNWDVTALDERWKVIDDLCWTFNKDQMSFSTYRWGATNAVAASYAAARSAASSYISNQTNWSSAGGTNYPNEYYYSYENSPTERIVSVQVSDTLIKVINIPKTNSIQHTAELYTKASINTGTYYDFDGVHALRNRTYFNIAFPEAYVTNRAITNFWVNPVTGYTDSDPSFNAFEQNVEPFGFVYKWNGTNGFRWR